MCLRHSCSGLGRDSLVQGVLWGNMDLEAFFFFLVPYVLYVWVIPVEVLVIRMSESRHAVEMTKGVEHS